jgi:hypothetical protein
MGGRVRRVYTTQTRARIEGSEDASARGRHAPCILGGEFVMGDGGGGSGICILFVYIR